MIYTGEYTEKISFPLGGIGTGSIGLAGNGSLIDWEIFNRPAKGSGNGYTHIAIKAEYDGKTIVKVLCADLKSGHMGPHRGTIYSGFGYGPDSSTMCAFPHFKNVTFNGEFPMAELYFEDGDFPGRIVMRAFNPMIPTDSKNSSIPAAFFDIEIQNKTEKAVNYSVAFSLQNPYNNSVNKCSTCDGITMLTAYNSSADKDDPEYGDLTVATNATDAFSQTYWYRGTWQDGIVAFWNEFLTGDLSDRQYSKAGTKDQGTIGKKVQILPGDKNSVKFALSWNIPNNHRYWEKPNDTIWKNYYATVFEDSAETARYCITYWDYLYSKTKEFKDALFSSTLDKVIVEAISATMSVLKSPTVLRLEDGSFYGWEGVNEKEGSCEGTCQHVWNYAYALCFLYPDLERTIRDLEFKYCMEDNGRTAFRLMLPLGSEISDFRACLDGQMGTVIKCYREWKISGDDNWLKSHWEDIKKILEYAWCEENPDKWDLNKDGVLEGRQHHTLDVELFGPSSWLQGMYLLALVCAARIADYFGETAKKNEYMSVFEKGYEWTKNNLFNGKYFIQKIDLGDKSILDSYDDVQNYWNEEKKEIKYQIASGSSIDQMLGQWHANILGLGEIFDKEQRKIACENVFKNNYKASLRNFVNPWRVFAFNDEAGTVICDFPEDTYKQHIPVPYCQEIMTGFEYAFAGLLTSEGYIDEGLTIVKAIRDRYDGKKRNPWNEMECGSNYARAMASFALLPIYSGFEFDLPDKYIGFNPIIDCDYKTIWSLGTGWGTFERKGKIIEIIIKHGGLHLNKIGLKFANCIEKVVIDEDKIDFSFENGIVYIQESDIHSSISAELK